MRIGYDAKRLYNNFTGLGNYCRTLVRNLQQNFPDNDYQLYTPRLNEGPETGYFLDNSRFTTHLADTAFKGYWRSYGMLSQLERNGIELYHGLSNELPFNIAKSKIKSIVTIHDLIFKVYPQTYPLIDRKIYDIKFKASCERADRVIAISESTRNDIVNFYGIDSSKIEVIYQAINPLYELVASAEEWKGVKQQFNLPEEYLLFVGSVEERKNLKLIIAAYEQLSEANRIPLVIVGRGKKHGELMMKAIEEKGLSHLVIWVDNLNDNNQMRVVYQNAIALIYPSLYEGFGLPVVEALLSKTPVITSNVSSLPEAGGPGSVLIDPKNPEELAYAIQSILDDSELRESMSSVGYAYAKEQFAPDLVSSQIMGCYLRTLKS